MLEFFGGFGIVWVLVWVKLDGELAVGAFDFFLRGRGREGEDVVAAGVRGEGLGAARLTRSIRSPDDGCDSSSSSEHHITRRPLSPYSLRHIQRPLISPNPPLCRWLLYPTTTTPRRPRLPILRPTPPTPSIPNNPPRIRRLKPLPTLEAFHLECIRRSRGGLLARWGEVFEGGAAGWVGAGHGDVGGVARAGGEDERVGWGCHRVEGGGAMMIMVVRNERREESCDCH